MITITERVQSLWYQPKLRISLWLLWPVSKLFQIITIIRRNFYSRLLPCYKVAVPVIVVGNITVGGSGKTPLVIYLVKMLQAHGFKPGIISRGYKGLARKVCMVTESSSAIEMGDEPVLMASLTGCPVVIGKKRSKAARYLLQRSEVNIILSDDGLQHYALSRDIEIAVIDSQRGFGNKQLLPLGPLREAVSRLKTVDLIVNNGGQDFYPSQADKNFTMQLFTQEIFSLSKLGIKKYLSVFKGQIVHAVAGIAHPDRFFQQLRAAGLHVIAHPFADHHIFTAEDLLFGDSYPVFMTEKDAVKCSKFEGDYWVVPVTAQLSTNFDASLLTLIKEIKR